MARFVILEKVGGRNRIYLEYNEQEFVRRLVARVLENLAIYCDHKRDKHTKEEVKRAIIEAFSQMAKEFKDRTVIMT